MDQQLASIFANASSFLLVGALVAALFFAGAGLRELRSDFLQGLLLIGIAGFFVAAHLYYFLNIPDGSRFAAEVTDLDFWGWGAMLLAPALIVMFLARGICDVAQQLRQVALIRLFFGLTLLCFVYMIGSTWSTDTKAIVTAFYGFTWLGLEQAAR